MAAGVWRRAAMILGAGLASACGAAAIEEQSSETATSAPSETGSSGSGASTADSSSGGAEESGEGGGNHNDESCDPFAQDCEAGCKCMPYSQHGGALNAHRCVEIAPDPAGLGEACTYRTSQPAGDDTCDQGLLCWELGEDGIGTCFPMCVGSWEDRSCADPALACVPNEINNLCFPSCDPLLQDCGENHECQQVNGPYVCFLPWPEQAGVGSTCVPQLGCSEGTRCTESRLLPGCEGDRCCTPYCDVSDPGASDACERALPGSVCRASPEPWRGYEHVGLCGLP